MKTNNTFLRAASLILAAAITLPLFGCGRKGGGDDTDASDETDKLAPGAGYCDPPASFVSAKEKDRTGLPTLTVDISGAGHEMIHGSAGFLYGISNEGVPDVNTLTPLKPKVLATKGALGTEHPYGDALDVAEEFFLSGGRQVQMYCSNYYGVFGVTADARDYAEVLRTVIAPAVVEWKDGMRERFPDIDKMIVYIPINEGTPVNGASSFEEAWRIYYEAIKSADKSACIAGPNDAVYRGHDGMASFLSYCRRNDCLPDVMTWHELAVSSLGSMGEHIADYRRICKSLGIDEIEVVINEYADFSDCGVPGRLVNWISRLEDNEVYGCLPFWHQANNLNDLAAGANQGNGAWWVYKWYGDMGGQTLPVKAENTTAEGFYGLSSKDADKKCVSVLCGGVDGDTVVVLDNVDKSGFFEGENVRVVVEAAYFTGYHGACLSPDTVLDGIFPVKDGKVTIDLEDGRFSTAYRITVTGTDREICAPTVGAFRAVYEAEDAALSGELLIDSQESPVEYPKYYCSGGFRVGGMDKDGDAITYLINVPADGRYTLGFLYGNGVGSTRNNAATHKPKNITQSLTVDGNTTELYLKNTLFYSMEGLAEKEFDLRSGYHTVTVSYSGEAGAFHDALVVTRSGAFGQDADTGLFFEAEAADFDLSCGSVPTSVRTVTDKAHGREDFSGAGYVTGLGSAPVGEGGGIRHIVNVAESGLYHLVYRASAEKDCRLLIYEDNTNLTFGEPAAEAAVTAGDGWHDVHAVLYLRQGINIIDTCADGDAALDSLFVVRAEDDMSVTVEAEDADGSFKTAKSGGVTYVTEMKANAGYLEFHVNAPTEGVWKMRVFQSNNDLCGTHSYNIKIIDRYASFTVNGEDAGRYFFPNTFSDDTFLERTVDVKLKKGDNTVRVYNDDSWHVLWGGSTSEPGKNELQNYTPNFDKFIFTPATADIELPTLPHRISVSSTEGGYAYCDKNTAADGDEVTLSLIPDGVIGAVYVNGVDRKDSFFTEDGIVYSAKLTVSGDVTVSAEFYPAPAGDFDVPEAGDAPGTVLCGGVRYNTVGDNLFSNGDFSDNSGKGMEQWYVGANTAGHPTSGGTARPSIGEDGSLSNLTPLSESGLLVKGSFEPQVSGNKFYFGYDGNRPDGEQHYLVEAIGEPWTSNAWNGAHSLLAFVKIKPATSYYFSFVAYTAGGAASVRYGAVKMGSFVPDAYSTSASLNFSGSGGMSCKNGDEQNVGGAWRRYESVVRSGDGDYFLFNAYWLQMCSFLCIGDFKLIEVEDTALETAVGTERLPAVTPERGGTPALPEEVTVVLSDGGTKKVPVEWLNADAVDTGKPGVSTVTGRVVLPDGISSNGTLLVTVRVVVR